MKNKNLMYLPHMCNFLIQAPFKLLFGNKIAKKGLKLDEKFRKFATTSSDP